MIDQVVLGAGNRSDAGDPALMEHLRRSEHRLRLLLQHLPAVIWTTDTDLRVTSIDGPALDDLSLAPPEVLGRSLYEVRHKGDTGVTASPRALRGEAVSEDHLWMGRRVVATVEPLIDGGDQIVGTMGIAVLKERAGSTGQVVEARAQIHDARRQASGGGLDAALRIGNLVIAPAAFAAYSGESRLDLTPTEFRLLLALAHRAGSVCTRTELFETVWGYDFLGDSRLVDMTVSRLRKKLRGSADALVSVRGLGYMLNRRGWSRPAR